MASDLMRPCPVSGCDGDLYLVLSTAVPLYESDPPWPLDVVADSWEVVCTEGHTVWHHVDQVRADNAAGLTEDDETGDNAPTFRPEPMLAAFRSPTTTKEA